jgi:very-short-patch-repair endonuclease
MKRLGLPSDAVARSRQLRRSATDAEQRLWSALREHFSAAKFRWQVPFGPYHADFASHGAKLVIEVDGSQHGERVEYDAARTHFLNGEGYRVLRFWNNEVLKNLDGVLAVIENTLSPCGRGQGEGPAASAAAETPSLEAPGQPGMPGARRSRAPASGRHPSPPGPSPTRGEGRLGQPSVGVS